ncbi:MAG: nuoL [Chitinophagaceae bacterium]|nr:nuoL [Chitinophagaceae bacterium]
MNYSIIALIPLLPLATFILLGLFGRKYFQTSGGIIATVALLASAIISLYVTYHYFFIDGKVNGTYRHITALNYTWLEFSPGISIDMGILIDPISMMMIVVVTFISLMVHIFSLGYMKGEDRFSTYFAFLSLFTFSMLGLVLSTNIFQLYIFWELVGLSSFLLIGYYFYKPSAVAASKKAFIVTRFADLGFLIGILMLGFHAQTLDISTLIQNLTNHQSPQFIGITTASFLGVSLLTWGLSLVFIGGAGKSAMFPLHIWLPDAMEGPTPVSALIHAATMVVAGVYLIARLFPVYALSAPQVLEIIMSVGAVSALIAAIIACTQTDIKRVLAYSTMSQIGYMMLALGVSKYGGEDGLGYIGSMFHLFTHAFFKSLLFLGAGAVIHFIHSNEMKDMGGLRKLMPLTHITFLIACLAIAGIPPFAGFFSKEEILLAAFRANKFIYGIALFTAGLTSFYMFRLYFSIFWNKPSTENKTGHHGEGTWSMKIPLVVLAVCSLLAGLVPFANYITSDGAVLNATNNIMFSIVPVAVSLGGILLSAYLYKKENDKPVRAAALFGTFYKAAHKKFYIDEMYLFVTQRILFNLIARPAAWVDKNIVDGFMNLTATTTGKVSESIKAMQSGRLQSYAIYFFGGVIAMAALFIYWWK